MSAAGIAEPKPSQGPEKVFDHKNNKFNRECVEVFSTDDVQSDGAHHAYRIEVYDRYSSNSVPVEDKGMKAVSDLPFQNGGLLEVGANGITDQALLAVVLDRMRGFNDGPFRCRENSIIITKIEEALMWMEKRSNDRSRRNVEGERIV